MKKKSGGRKGKRSGHRKNPHRKGSHRRRRNPGSGSFGTRLARLAGMGLLTIGTGVGVYAAQGAVQASHPNFALYGIPAIGLGVGALAAAKYPMAGVAIGIGAVAPLAVPVAAKVLPAATSSGTAGVALGRAVRQLRAVGMGATYSTMSERRAMGMSAVHG